MKLTQQRVEVLVVARKPRRIENIEELDERISEFIEKKKRANAFDIRYSDTVDLTGQPWEKCSQVLSRKDVVERLSKGW